MRKLILVVVLFASLQYVKAESGTMAYIGCYKTRKMNRVPEDRRWVALDMTLEKCANHCNGYRYFGIQAGIHCGCVNDYKERDEDPRGCYVKCRGNSQQTCGDWSSTAIFEIDDFTPVIVMQYMGCFKDRLFNRDLSERSWSSNEMTLELCASHCEGYTFMATQRKEQCRCGNSYGEHGEDSDGCDDECDGNSGQICGGDWRNSVYKITQEIEHMTFETDDYTVHRSVIFNNNSKLIIPDRYNSVKTVSGKVIRWFYTTNDTLPIHLAFFRPTSDDLVFSYVGGTDFTPTEKGDHVIELEKDDQIEVVNGDAIGIFRPAGVPYEYAKFPECGNHTQILFAVSVDDIFNEGQLYTTRVNKYCGVPLVAADIRHF